MYTEYNTLYMKQENEKHNALIYQIEDGGFYEYKI